MIMMGIIGWDEVKVFLARLGDRIKSTQIKKWLRGNGKIGIH